GTHSAHPQVTSENIFKDGKLLLNNGMELVLGDIIFHQHTLIGRGTVVVRATLDSLSHEWFGKNLIVKFSYAAETRSAEAAIIDHAWTVAESDEDYAWVRNHLPRVLHAQEIKSETADERKQNETRENRPDQYATADFCAK